MTALPHPAPAVDASSGVSEAFESRELCRRCGLHRAAHVEVSRTGVRMTFPDCGHRRYDAVFTSPYTRHNYPRSIR